MANLLKEVIKTAQHKKEATQSASSAATQGASNGATLWPIINVYKNVLWNL